MQVQYKNGGLIGGASLPLVYKYILNSIDTFIGRNYMNAAGRAQNVEIKLKYFRHTKTCNKEQKTKFKYKCKEWIFKFSFIVMQGNRKSCESYFMRFAVFLQADNFGVFFIGIIEFKKSCETK